MKIVLTGGPCAGKTTLTQVIARVFPKNIAVVPEAASLLFSGGFPRWTENECKKSTQRAIYHVQTELEQVYSAKYKDKILVLDRGVIDGAAYWPEGADHFFTEMKTSLERDLARYDKVIYLESASRSDYELHRASNANRKETWDEAKVLDEITLELWKQHPNFVLVRNQKTFSVKVNEVLGEIGLSLPMLGSV